MENAAVLSPQSGLQQHAERRRNGKIKISAKSKSTTVLKLLMLTLLLLTVYAFWSFDYKEIALGEAVASTLHNMKTVFLEPRLSTDTMQNILYQLLVTFCLGILSTVFGAVLAFFCALLCAKNIAASGPANLIKSLVAVVRAVPTVLWVLIFAVSAGLGSVAAVIGLTFHSFAYLTKVYAESIEEVDEEPSRRCVPAVQGSGRSYSRQLCRHPSAVWWHGRSCGSRSTSPMRWQWVQLPVQAASDSSFSWQAAFTSTSMKWAF